MPTAEEPRIADTDPVVAIRQYPLLVIGLALVFGVIGAWYAGSGPNVYVATTSLIVEDTRSTTGRSSTDPERYVADQAAILRSAIVAERASALAPTLDPPAEITAREIAANRTITSSSESNFVEVTFSANDPLVAQTGANAIRIAYRDAVSAALAQNSQAAAARLDTAIETTVEEITSLQTRISESLESSGTESSLDRQLQRIVLELRVLGENSVLEGEGGAGGLTATKELAVQTDRLSSALTRRIAAAPVGDTRRLLRRQQEAAVLLGELTSQRTDVTVDAQLSGNGVAFFAPAGPGRRAGVPVSSAAVVGTVLGGLLGAGAAFLLSHRRQRVEDALKAGEFLGAPLLADVREQRPRRVGMPFRHPAKSSAVPVLDDPTAARSRAYRTLGEMLGRGRSAQRAAVRPPRPYGTAGERNAAVIACVAASRRDVSAAVALNVALAAGMSGLKVGLIDADIAGAVASHLARELRERPSSGSGDLIDGSAIVDVAGGWMEVRDGTDVSIARLGDGGAGASDQFGSDQVRSILTRFADDHDLVVASLSPMLETAQATILHEVDGALIVVPYRSSGRELIELRRRMEIMKVPVVGYVFADPSVEGADRPAASMTVPLQPKRRSGEANGLSGGGADHVRGTEKAG